jgi:small subunit ribosomal protein S5
MFENKVKETGLVTNKEASAERAEGRFANKGGFKKPFNKGKRPMDDFEEKVISIKRISKTTKGGRRMRFSALVVVGNKKGSVGFGIGKSIEVPVAIKKALKDAKKNVKRVLINKKGTLFHEITCSSGAARVLLKPAPVGAGIIAGGPIRAVVELAGYKDLCAKNLGSNAAINMVQTTMKCLLGQRSPKTIANLRDKRMKEL